MKVTIIIGANRVRGISKLKGIEHDVRIFTSMTSALSKSGYSIQVKYCKPIPADTDIFIFSGHGGLIHGNMVLLAPQKYRSSVNALVTDDLIASNDIPSNANVILDACYSSAIKNGSPLRFIKGLDLSKTSLSYPDAKNFVHSGLFSSDKDSPSYEINVNGKSNGAMLYGLNLLIRWLADSSSINKLNDLTFVPDTIKSFLKSNYIMQDVNIRSVPGTSDNLTPFFEAMVRACVDTI